MKAILATLCLGLSLAGRTFAAEGEKVFEYSFGRELQTVPAVDHDGTIFVAGKGAVGALTPVGAEKWKIELSAGSQADISGITISENRIYVTSTQGLYSFDKAGATIWTNGMGIRNSKVALDGTNNLYVVDTNGVLHALQPDGSERWTNSVEPFMMPLFAVRDFGPVVGPSGMVYTMAGNLVAFSSTGEKLWSQVAVNPTAPVVNEDGSVYYSAAPNFAFSLFGVSRVGTNGVFMWGTNDLSGSSVAPPVVGPDKTLYVPVVRDPLGPDRGGIIAFADDGQIKWRLEQFSTEVSPAVAEDGTIYVASNGGVVTAVNSNGSRRWSYTNGVPAVKGLTIGIDSSVLLAQTNGTVLALSGTSPVTSRVWPVYGRDPRQTSQQRIAVTLTALPVEEIGTNSALLKAELNPQGNAATVYFEYSSEGPVIKTAAQEFGATNGTMQFSQSVTGLSAGTLYAVRAVSSNAFGISRSEPVSFRTLGDQQEVPPTLASLQAAASGGGTVTFSGDGVISITTPIEFTTNAVVDANGHQVVLTGSGHGSLLRFATGVVVTLKGLSLVDGRAASALENGLPVSKGGALLNNGADLTLIDCLFSNNVAYVARVTPPPEGPAVAAGGAIWQSGGSLTVQNCRFLTNSVSGDLYVIAFGGGFFITYPQSRGGAIYLTGGRVEVSNSLFDGNRLERGRPGEGGAIYLADGEFMISTTTFSANSADTVPRGGGIYLASGSLTVTNSTLAKNVLAAASPVGGNVDGSAFGAALFNAGTVLVRNSAILTNEAIGGPGGNGTFGYVPPGPSAGAGIYNAGALGVENSTFSGNSSRSSLVFPGASSKSPGEASAIYSSGTAGVTNVTIAWNIDANAAVSGVNATNVVLKNTLLAGGRTDVTATNFTDAGHNMTTGEAAFTQSSSQTNANPRLGPIGNYGGTTLVYPLAAGSPAINAADNGAAPAIDQRGRARPFGPAADIGAFESSPPFYVWGQIRGYHDPSTTLTVGTNVFAADAEGFFSIGPLSAGTNQIELAATNALFSPNPWVIDVQADQESSAVTSFQLHTLTYVGVVIEPPTTSQLAAFILAGLPGEQWKVDMSLDLTTWTDVSTYTLDASGLAEIRVPNERAVFLRANPVN